MDLGPHPGLAARGRPRLLAHLQGAVLGVRRQHGQDQQGGGEGRGYCTHLFDSLTPPARGMLLPMAYLQIRYERRNRVARITLNRPELRNAQSRVLLEELDAAFTEAAAADAVRAVVLAGSGEHFSSGHMTLALAGRCVAAKRNA